jgi:hypothetical protein
MSSTGLAAAAVLGLRTAFQKTLLQSRWRSSWSQTSGGWFQRAWKAGAQQKTEIVCEQCSLVPEVAAKCHHYEKQTFLVLADQDPT